MDNEKITSDAGSYSRPSSTEASLAPGRTVIGGSLENVSTAGAMLSRALEEYRQGNFENAESTLLKLIRNSERTTSPPTTEDTEGLQQRMTILASASTALGRTYMRLNRNDEAQANFSKAVTLFEQVLKSGGPTNPQIYSDYGIALFMIGRTADAITNLQNAHTQGSKSGETYLYLGVAMKQRGDYANAEHCLKEAIDASPLETLAHEELGEALKLQGTERYPDAARAYYSAAYAAASAGDLERALSDADKASALDPDSALIFAMRAELLRLLNRNEEALATVEQTLRLDSADLKDQLFTTRAGALQALGRSEEALAAAEEALAHSEQNATALGIKGQALHEL